MARTSWFDEKAEHPLVQEQVTKLESFTAAMADGMCERAERGVGVPASDRAGVWGGASR